MRRSTRHHPSGSRRAPRASASGASSPDCCSRPRTSQARPVAGRVSAREDLGGAAMWNGNHAPRIESRCRRRKPTEIECELGLTRSRRARKRRAPHRADRCEALRRDGRKHGGHVSTPAPMASDTAGAFAALASESTQSRSARGARSPFQSRWPAPGLGDTRLS